MEQATILSSFSLQVNADQFLGFSNQTQNKGDVRLPKVWILGESFYLALSQGIAFFYPS
jgi:hypothetical protein